MDPNVLARMRLLLLDNLIEKLGRDDSQIDYHNVNRIVNYTGVFMKENESKLDLECFNLLNEKVNYLRSNYLKP